MKKNPHKLLTLGILLAAATGAIHVINKMISSSALRKNKLPLRETKIFRWRFGAVYYTKQGTGTPLVLIHDLTPESSGYEWHRVESALAENHTVYTLDLLGCGRSDKPGMIYTNFLYVQLLCDFLKQVVGEKADVIASGLSCSFTIMACHNERERFQKLLLVNPPSPLILAKCPGRQSKLIQLLLELPVFGTLIYHMAMSRESLRSRLLEESFFNPFLVKEDLIDACYEGAHRQDSGGKHLYASLRANYLNLNIVHGITSINQSVMILEGGKAKEAAIGKEYTQLNPAIERCVLPGTKQLPQLEAPEDFLEQVRIFL